jgi:hypothetical protein
MSARPMSPATALCRSNLHTHRQILAHIETMANAVAEGAREGGASVDIKRVPELVPEDVARKSYYKVDQKAPIAKIEELLSAAHHWAFDPSSQIARRLQKSVAEFAVACQYPGDVIESRLTATSASLRWLAI